MFGGRIAAGLSGFAPQIIQKIYVMLNLSDINAIIST